MEITPDKFATRFAAFAKWFPSRADLEIVLQVINLEHIKAGKRLIEYGGPCSTLYLVWEGHLTASIEDKAGKILLGEIGPGEWVGEVTLIEPGPATASVVADEDSILLSISHEDFNKIREKHPAAAGTLMQALSLNIADRLRTYGNRAIHEIVDGEYELEELGTQERTAIVNIIAGLMGINGVAKNGRA